MRLAAARLAWQRWQAAAGDWQAWVVCPTLLSPEIESINPEPPQTNILARSSALAAELAASLAKSAPSVVLLDLDPTLGAHVAAQLNAGGVANAVLALPRWPYARALLPVEELLHALTTQASRLVAARQRHAVFVVDGCATLAVDGRSLDDDRADNRHRPLVSDLPQLAALRARGVERVIKVARG